jgi:hypothetical protein
MHGILLSSSASNTGHMVSELAKQLWCFTDLICLSVQSSDTLHKCIKPAKKLRPFSLSVQIGMRFYSVSTSIVCSDACCDVEGWLLCFVKSFLAALAR